MNDFEGRPSTPTREAGPAEAGATLFGFIDAANHLQHRISEALARVGLSWPKYEVLKYLTDSDESVTLGCLAENRSCARSNITQIVDRLEAEGLVRRVDDPTDRRSVRAELTPTGSARAEEGSAQMEMVMAEFAATLDVGDRAELMRLLEKLR